MNAPKLWISLPFTLRNISSVATFKTQLKTYLFNMYFGEFD